MASNNYNSEEHFNRIHQSLLRNFQQSQEQILEDYEEQLDEAVKHNQISRQKAEEEYRRFERQKRREFAKTASDDELKIKKQASDILAKYEDTLLKESDRNIRAQVFASRNLRLKSFQEEYSQRSSNLKLLEIQQRDIQDRIAKAASEDERSRFEAQLKSMNEKYSAEEEWIQANADKAKKSQKLLLENNLSHAEEIINNPNASKEDLAAAQKSIEAAKELAASADEQKAIEKTRSDLAMKELSAQAEDRKQAIKDRNQQKKDEMKWLLKTEEGRTQLLKNATVAMVGALSKAFDALEQPINSFYEYQAKYEARMQGSENQYNKMMSNIGFSIGLSPFIKQQKMVENLQRLIDTGTNYNLELRAYIATVSENIASTFDAFDSNLMRLIRIQQSDSTAARMGMEAALTKILNSRFSDSSYLNGTSDTVAGNLLDASAQLSHQMAAEFEFVTQKWLGALYSLGVGDQTITNIAQGLGYLGSGNIDALAGNDQLMSLLAMSASRGGASISDFLTGNLTASNTEKLLKGMVELLGDIANNTDSNKVTRAAFANVFGITNTDLRSISNLTQSDIDYLSNTNLNYSQALVESSNQLKEISNRMHISTMISNLIDNATTNSALMIGGNAATYTLYKALNVVSSLVGDRGMEIPGIQALGTGTASGIDILSVAKAGFAGASLLAGLIGSLGNISSGGLPALDKWAGYEKSLQRGEGLILKDYGVQSGFSSSAQYNNASNQSGDDMTKSAMQSSTESATENMSEEDKAAQDSAKQYQDKMSNLADNIMKLIGENAENSLKVLISNDEKNKIIPVKLADLEGSASDKLRAALESILLTGASLTGDINNSTTPFIELLKSALSDLTVTVDNDLSNPLYVQQSIVGGI